jgi:hypothetical protein
LAIGIAVVVGVGPGVFAQEQVWGHDNSAVTVDAKERQTHPRPGSNTGISLVVPIGSVSVGPRSLDGEHIHVRRMTVSGGMAIVEVSTTPFVPVVPANEGSRGAGRSIVRPDQPASW